MAYTKRNGSKRRYEPNEDDKLPNKGIMRHESKEKKSNDYYRSSFNSTERTVNIKADQDTNATARVYPVVGERLKTFNANPMSNAILADKPSPFEATLFDAIASPTGQVAARFDCANFGLIHNYLGIKFFHDIPTNNQSQTLNRWLRIMNERLSLIGSYQFYNLNINAWTLTPGGPTSGFDTAFTACLFMYQTILRNIIMKISYYDILLAFEDEIKKNEFNFYMSTANLFFAELKRSRRRGPIQAWKNLIKNEFVDIENYNFELAPLLIPSRETEGMDSILIHTNVLELIPDVQVNTPAGATLDYRAIFQPISEFDLTIGGALSVIRGGTASDVDNFFRSFDSWLDSSDEAISQFPLLFADLRSSLEVGDRSNLLNWKKGFTFANSDNITAGPTNWGMITDIMVAQYTGLGGNVDNITDTANRVDRLTQMVRFRTLWSDKDGIPTMFKTENFYPWIIPTTAITTSGNTTLLSEWSFFADKELVLINRQGYQLNVRVSEVDPNSVSGAVSAMITLGAVSDNFPVLLPTINEVIPGGQPVGWSANVYANVLRVESLRALGKLFYYYQFNGTTADRSVIGCPSEDYVLPVAMQLYWPASNIDRYYRQNSTFKQFVNGGVH